MNAFLRLDKLDLQHRGDLLPRALRLSLALLVAASLATSCIEIANAQTGTPGAAPASNTPPAKTTPAKTTAAKAAPAGARAAGSPLKVEANLLQLMRGIPYPSSNVVFAAQGDITKLEKPADPSISPNPLTSSFGGWQAVENAALAIGESANLMVLPGRVCSNGKPVPVQRADWTKYARQLQSASMEVYKAAQKKDTDAIVDAAGTLSDSCMACHSVYREKSDNKDRCTP